MSLNDEKDALIRIFQSDAKEDIYETLKRIRRQPSPKDAAVSRTQREKAEAMMTRGKHNMRIHEKILECCARSVAKAPPGSEELAQAYAQRSKLLLHLRKYQECIKDIIRALKMTTSNTLKVELHCRMAECSVAQNMGVASSILQEAEICLVKVDPLEAERCDLVSKLKRTKAMLEEPLDLYLDPQPAETRTPTQPTTSAVRIEYSKKYGRHLVAARDIHPGELVLVEPVHAAMKNYKLGLCTTCYHCLSMCWTLVPCDNCDEVLFCSDACKQEAMAKYHDIECPIVVALKVVKGFIEENVYLALKIVIMAIKEAGSVKNLMKMVMKVDDCEDKVTKGWMNGEFCSGAFSSFYSLSDMSIYSKQEYIVFANALVTAVMANYTELFGPSSCIPTIDVMLMDDNIMFIAALMLRMSNICFVNAKRFIEPNTTVSMEDIDMIHIVRNPDAFRGFVISAHRSLLNHSCNPNVYSVCTDDGKIVYYCALPIPKGSQIYDCYAVPFYSTLPISERKRRLYDSCLIKCDCEACEQNWVSASYQSNRTEHIIVQPSKFFNDEMLRPIMDRFKTYVDAIGSQDLQWITVTSKLVEKDLKILFESTTYPNPSIISMLYMLRVIMEMMYGCTIKHIPRWCIEHFKEKQSHILYNKHTYKHMYNKHTYNNDYNCHKYNKNDDHKVRVCEISEKTKGIKINPKYTANKLIKLENKENICV